MCGSTRNQGDFVRCVSHVTNDLKAAGIITGAQKGGDQELRGEVVICLSRRLLLSRLSVLAPAVRSGAQQFAESNSLEQKTNQLSISPWWKPASCPSAARRARAPPSPPTAALSPSPGDRSSSAASAARSRSIAGISWCRTVSARRRESHTTNSGRTSFQLLPDHADGDVTDSHVMPTFEDVLAAVNRAVRIIDGEQVGETSSR